MLWKSASQYYTIVLFRVKMSMSPCYLTYWWKNLNPQYSRYYVNPQYSRYYVNICL